MLNTCLTSIFKINDISIKEIDVDEISAFVTKNFPEDAQINLKMFKNWMLKNKYVFYFLDLLKLNHEIKIEDFNNI